MELDPRNWRRYRKEMVVVQRLRFVDIGFLNF